jgi:hypothetical protein
MDLWWTKWDCEGFSLGNSILISPPHSHSVQNLLSSHLLSKTVKIRIYKTISWSLTLRGEQRLRVFANKVLRRIFGLKRDEVTEEWRELHNEELHHSYFSPIIIRIIKSRRMRWVGHVAQIE